VQSVEVGVSSERSIDYEDLWIEIRSRWSTAPTSIPTAELERLGIDLREQTRVLVVERGAGPLRQRHLDALVDPLAEWASLGRRGDMPAGDFVDVFCLPGVTDTEGEMAALALQWAGLPGVRCRAGLRYRFAGWVPPEVRSSVERLLGNPLIHLFTWSDDPSADAADEERRHIPWPHVQTIDSVTIVDLRGFSEEELIEVSRRYHLALDLVELQTIQRYYLSLGRAPTDIELHSLALTWSEHCSHKTFKATIRFEHEGRHEVISGLLETCIVAPTVSLNRPWVRSAFVDNAGVIAFDDRHDLAFKVETHNHPSALEPYGGAHTGVGGVIRDILAVSADPIANTDVLCFGPPGAVGGGSDPGTTYRGVVRGIADYGNNMGIPTVGGAILFHPGYTANPLVYCGTLGLAPAGSHPRQPRPGDAVVLLGGRTGRDGLHGATMSSETLDRERVAGSAVQIGAPITEKLLRDVIPHLRDERLYHAITDCGAGGLCSAVGEMGHTSGEPGSPRLGVEVDLALVPLKYQGLRPWEIWLSEAQERMVLAVPEESLPRLQALCRAYDVEATVLGRFRDDGALLLRDGRRLVAEVPMAFLHGGRPARVLEARWKPSDVGRLLRGRPGAWGAGAGDRATGLHRGKGRVKQPSPARALLNLLAHPNIASKEVVIRRYDHEVQASTVVKPLVGRAGPSDAAVLKPLPDSWRGVAVAHGINPLYTALDPHDMAIMAVDEALRNLVAVGGSIDDAALLDNFCWGDVDDPDELGALVRAAQGCRDAAFGYGVPFISGKDSLRNTSVDVEGQHSIPGTLLISAVGVVPDVRRAITMDLKSGGSLLYLLGLTTGELGGSHYRWISGEYPECTGLRGDERLPSVRPEESRDLMRRITGAIREGLILSCHDLSEGGLAVAASEMALAGGLGVDLELDRVPAETDRTEALLFAESPGRFLIEVASDGASDVERIFEDLPYARVGTVGTSSLQEARFTVRRRGDTIVDLPLVEIDAAWRAGMPGPSSDVDMAGASSMSDDVAGIFTTDNDVARTSVSAPSGTHGVPFPRFARFQPAEAETEVRATQGAANDWNHRPRAMILAAAGVNCDRETAEACRLAGADAELVHLNDLVSGERRMADFGMLILPGGFSYGDHLGAGAMLATALRHHFLEDLLRFIDDGRPVLGICNGFQVLARLGLLGDIALVPNASGRFECRWVRLRVEPSPCLFLHGLEECAGPFMELPIAHGQGRLVASGDALPSLLPLAPLRYEDNPNGSVAGIAGVCSSAGNVFGLMPHPERYLTPYHNPDWPRTAGRPALPPLGLVLFRNAARYVREAL